ncbi:MAG: carbohydrate ABC transporter permease, partial [Chloroflexi bacterium]
MSARLRVRILELVPRYAILVLLAALFVFPFYWMLVISLGTLQSVFVFPPIL